MQFRRVTKTAVGLGAACEFCFSRSLVKFIRNYDYVTGRFIFLRCKYNGVEFMLMVFQGSSDSTEAFIYYREISTGK